MFAQVDDPLARTRDGLGIGLALARRLAELHGGSIVAASGGPGRGSTFTVSVPISTDAGAGPTGDEARASGALEARRLRILIVDDNHDGADMLALTLNILGHKVSTIYEPLKAVAAADAFRPDVAFLDIGMPALNGYELAALLKREPWASRLLLVALTGWGQDENRQRSAAAGFDEHLVKPIELETIDRICQMALAYASRQPVA